MVPSRLSVVAQGRKESFCGVGAGFEGGEFDLEERSANHPLNRQSSYLLFHRHAKRTQRIPFLGTRGRGFHNQRYRVIFIRYRNWAGRIEYIGIGFPVCRVESVEKPEKQEENC